MPLQLIDRFNPRLRKEEQAAINEGNLRKRADVALLDDPGEMRTVIALSLILFLVGGVFFVVLNLFSYVIETPNNGGSFNGWQLLLWFAINIVVYILVLFLHEGIHALAFAFWGGTPYFGAKLPVALYCGARNQIFRRNHYLVVGLAPLVMITIAGILFTLLSPALAAYTLFGTIGNFAGAAGDLQVAIELWRQPKDVLVEDTETGYRVWEIVLATDTK